MVGIALPGAGRQPRLVKLLCLLQGGHREPGEKAVGLYIGKDFVNGWQVVGGKRPQQKPPGLQSGCSHKNSLTSLIWKGYLQWGGACFHFL